MYLLGRLWRNEALRNIYSKVPAAYLRLSVCRTLNSEVIIMIASITVRITFIIHIAIAITSHRSIIKYLLHHHCSRVMTDALLDLLAPSREYKSIIPMLSNSNIIHTLIPYQP